MYHNLEVPDSCKALWQECQKLVPALLKDCQPQKTDLIVDDENPIQPGSSAIYLIKQGDIYETYDGQQIVIHEEGDLVNVDALARAKATSYETDFPATVDAYDGQEFISKILDDPTRFALWNQYICSLSHSYQLLMAYFSRQDTDYLPEFREYKKDDIIIEEGTEGDEVFTLVKGTARVMSNGEDVGEIHKDEIFGALAALTNTPRVATIVATSDCDTLVATRENFRSILDTRPDIVQKLIQDMARTIVSSNERIIELSKENS